MHCRHLFLCAFLAVGSLTLVRADDWPQWRGADRNGLSKETGLLKAWPKDGPKLLWKQTSIGAGYSTPVAVGDRLYVMVDRKDEEFLVAMAVKDGSTVWSTKIGKVGVNQRPPYPGTRCTPTVDGDRIYVLGSDGDLACVEKLKGQKVWAKNVKKEYDGLPGVWAYSESVLVDGDQVICSPGGKKATMLAVKKKDGEEVWKCATAEGDAAGYSSPIVVEVGGVRQYIQFLGAGLVGVNAKTGKFLWRYDETKDQMANIPTPVFFDDCVFTSTSRNGSGLNRIKVEKGTVTTEQVYYNNTKLNSIGGVVRIGDYVYGTEAKGQLVCLDFKTGKEKWRKTCVGAASICFADGMLYVRGQGGSGFGPETTPQVALVEASPKGYVEKGRFDQPDHGKRPAWAHPIVANGRLYLRDGDVMLCYDVKAE